MVFGALTTPLGGIIPDNLVLCASVSMVLFVGACGPISMNETMALDCTVFRSKGHYDFCKKQESLGALPDYNIEVAE